MQSNKEIAKFVGGKIKEYRTARNITQQELAEQLSTTSQTISRYESGILEINQESLYKLAEFFKVSMNSFFPDNKNSFDELEVLFDKNKNILSEDDKEYIKFIIEKRKKEIDKQLGKEE
jgi:transcriptional regulator with XRE-family HTH domain